MRKLKIILLALALMFSYSYKVAPAITDRDYVKAGMSLLEELRYTKELDKFIDQLGYDESRNDWTIINKIGAFGEFQFIYPTLKFLGYGHITLGEFRKDPNIFPRELQRKVVKVLINYNTIKMDSYITKYDGQMINGIVVTKAGILAACHLGGPTSVAMFLDSNGKINKRDTFHTSIRDYLFKYEMYDLVLRTI